MGALKDFLGSIGKKAALTTENMTVEELMALANKPFESLTVMDKLRLSGPLNRFNRENEQIYSPYQVGMNKTADDAYRAAQIQLLREAGLLE